MYVSLSVPQKKIPCFTLLEWRNMTMMYVFNFWNFRLLKLLKNWVMDQIAGLIP